VPWEEAVSAIFSADVNSTTRAYLKSDMKFELLQDVIPFPSAVFGFGDHEKISSGLAKVWIGTKGNVTPLHFDMCHGCLIQISGTKNVILFPITSSQNLYPVPSSAGAPRTSRLDLPAVLSGCKVATERYPLVHSAVGGVQCTVHPGEALYIPPFWWHHVTAAEHNVSVLMPFDLSSEEQRRTVRPWTAPDWGVSS
jgi:hypothetical protein